MQTSLLEKKTHWEKMRKEEAKEKHTGKKYNDAIFSLAKRTQKMKMKEENGMERVKQKKFLAHSFFALTTKVEFKRVKIRHKLWLTSLRF